MNPRQGVKSAKFSPEANLDFATGAGKWFASKCGYKYHIYIYIYMYPKNHGISSHWWFEDPPKKSKKKTHPKYKPLFFSGLPGDS